MASRAARAGRRTARPSGREKSPSDPQADRQVAGGWNRWLGRGASTRTPQDGIHSRGGACCGRTCSRSHVCVHHCGSPCHWTRRCGSRFVDLGFNAYTEAEYQHQHEPQEHSSTASWPHRRSESASKTPPRRSPGHACFAEAFFFFSICEPSRMCWWVAPQWHATGGKYRGKENSTELAVY